MEVRRNLQINITQYEDEMKQVAEFTKEEVKSALKRIEILDANVAQAQRERIADIKRLSEKFDGYDEHGLFTSPKKLSEHLKEILVDIVLHEESK